MKTAPASRTTRLPLPRRITCAALIALIGATLVAPAAEAESALSQRLRALLEARLNGSGASTDTTQPAAPSTPSTPAQPTSPGDWNPDANSSALQLAKPPFTLDGDNAYFVKDAAYGPDPRHRFDIFLPKNSYDRQTRLPLVIFIHGGGFSSGEKEKAYSSSNQKMIKALLAQGVAFATINYPLISKKNEKDGLLKSLKGSQRALQYLKYEPRYNIDPNRVVLLGSSAGASTALWLAFHDDMADLGSSDPVAQQSTRVQGVAATQTQATLDVVGWEPVFAEYNWSVDDMGKSAPNFYGASSSADLYTAATVAYRQEVDFLGMMDASDPEIWLATDGVPVKAPSSTGILYHHPYHVRTLRDKAHAVGLKASANVPALKLADSSESMTDFILRKLR